jgi:hypothetical protein
MVDGIGKDEELLGIIGKVKEIVKSFTYKTSLLEKESLAVQQDELLIELEKVMECIEADGSVSLDDPNSLSSDSAESNGRAGLELTGESTIVQNLKMSCDTKLKKDCPTRWNTLLTMLDSVLKNQELVERCLTRLRLFDKLLSDEEWTIVRNLTKFLVVFQSATEVFSGSKYSTLSFVLLFRAEICQALSESQGDCDIVQHMKQRMRYALEHRFPITELHVVAAMLDSSQRNLADVQNYLIPNDVTSVDVFRRSMEKYLDLNGAQQQVVASASASGQRVESTEAQLDAPSSSWKRAKLDLLSKHIESVDTFDREIQQYRCLSVSTDDVLSWWSSQRHTFPQLSMLAKTILAIPATSTPSERVFSTAGLILSAKRSRLAPSKVDKIIFVHDNAQ